MSVILVTGTAGQLGGDLVELLRQRQRVPRWNVVPLTRADLELTDAGQVMAIFERYRPAIVVNCAAYNWVDRAESEPDVALEINALAVRTLALNCSARNIPLMHVSTDHLFAGHSLGRSWKETDRPEPASTYAVSKYAGELFVQAHCHRYWIVRTCGLYGRNTSRGKGNFVETMLRLAQERDELRVVNDQVCTPTSTRDLAEVLCCLLESEEYGLFHATNSGACSWFEFACEIFRLANLTPQVVPICSRDYLAAARRPAYSVLDCTRLQAVTGRVMRPWQTALTDYLQTRTASAPTGRGALPSVS